MIKKRVKIVRIIARLNIGGPAIHAVLLTEALNDGGFESVLVAGEVDKGEGDMAYLAKEKGICPVAVPELGRRIHPFRDLIALWKIYKLIRRERPDIVHTHTAKAGALGRLAAILAGVPVKIHTFHGNVFQGYFNKRYARFFIFVEKMLACFTTYVVAISQEQKNEICEVYKIARPDRVKVIPLGLELEALFSLGRHNGHLRKQFKMEDDVVAVGMVGRLAPIKNHQMFLEAAKRSSELLGGNLKVKYLIIGDGGERQSLEERSRALGLNGDVIFCGWQRDVAGVYSDVDIVALTSINEGTPVSLIEALAAGRPVVATDVGGVCDVVEDGENGYLVRSGDAKGFSARLAELIKDSQKRQAFGLRGRESIRSRFTKERLIGEIKVLYEKALVETGPVPN